MAMPGMEVLQRRINKNKNNFVPTNLQLVKHLFFSKGFTPKQFREDFTIPEIIEIVQTEVYLKEKEAKALKKRKR